MRLNVLILLASFTNGNAPKGLPPSQVYTGGRVDLTPGQGSVGGQLASRLGRGRPGTERLRPDLLDLPGRLLRLLPRGLDIAVEPKQQRVAERRERLHPEPLQVHAQPVESTER